MDYELSKFNLVSHYDGKVLIFNSLKNTFTTIQETEEDKIYNLEKLSITQLKDLEKRGIVVSKSADEDKMAFLKYVELVKSQVLHLIILPTYSCNFRCTYCYEDKTSGVMTEETMDSIAAFVKKAAKNVSSINVSWFGGEPLMCIDIIEKLSAKLMNIARSYKKPYFSNITSNGYFLTVDNLRKLLKCNIIHYQITIDGNAKMHNKTRFLVNGEGSYEKIINNLRNIRDYVTTCIFTIVLRTNLTKESIEDLDQYANTLDEEFGKDNRFSFMFRKVGNWGGEDIKKIADDIIDQDDMLIEKLLNMKHTFFLATQFPHFEKYPLCYASSDNNLVIDPKGQILKCTVDLKGKSNNVAQLSLDGTLEYNENYCQWVYPIIGRKIPDKCKICALYANCFASQCPLVYIECDRYKPAKCNDLDKELMVLYKMRKDRFVDIVL